MMVKSKIGALFRTLPLLGISNIRRVGLYRLKLAAGWRPAPTKQSYPGGPIFDLPYENTKVPSITLTAFGWQAIKLDGPPDWQKTILPPYSRIKNSQDWKESLDLLKGRDAKGFWEWSRFYWAPQFALAARNGDKLAGARLEYWLDDWVRENPPYQGINWSCGQEASIRTLNLALTALLLKCQSQPSQALKWVLKTHRERIVPTISYALSQDNNHGSSEACALYILGSWGRVWGDHDAERLERRGLRLLSERALRLIQPDGSPAQYSVTYHRANLETFAFAEVWARKMGSPTLPKLARERIVKGTKWLQAMVDPETGDAPNVGANDSSDLFNILQEPYRDFRSTVDLAAKLFDKAHPWSSYKNSRISTLDLEEAETALWPKPTSKTFSDGGHHCLFQGKAFAHLRFPRFRFRPSQADALHLDLRVEGVNLLRDAGSFSYAEENSSWYSGTGAHNTIEFDGRDQMPRLGRFLFGDWIKADTVEKVRNEPGSARAGAGYTDRLGAGHHRTVRLEPNSLICKDVIFGDFSEACLRWRLAPGGWHLKGALLCDGKYTISIELNGLPVVPLLSTTWESRYYHHSAEVPLVSVKTNAPGTLVTTIAF